MSGHGHVRLRADGVRARCDGPTICSDCALELAQLQADEAERRRRTEVLADEARRLVLDKAPAP